MTKYPAFFSHFLEQELQDKLNLPWRVVLRNIGNVAEACLTQRAARIRKAGCVGQVEKLGSELQG